MKRNVRNMFSAIALAGATSCVVSPYGGVDIEGPGPGRVVVEAPPPIREEIIPPAPSPNHIWIRGHWGYHDRYAWEPGRYVVRPRRGAEWVPGHWDDTHHGWAWKPGH